MSKEVQTRNGLKITQFNDDRFYLNCRRLI